MHLKKYMKFALAGFAILGILFAGVIYYASQKISEDDIKAWTITAIEKSMPGARSLHW